MQLKRVFHRIIRDFPQMLILQRLILILITIFWGVQLLQAQTYRINVENGGASGQSFVEVYEYDFVSEKPSFPGGDSKLTTFINETRQYPREAYRNGIQGRVTCSFVVNTDGSISHISVLRGIESSLNKEAVRVMSKMPAWTPGRHNGRAVPVRVVWSVPFRK